MQNKKIGIQMRLHIYEYLSLLSYRIRVSKALSKILPVHNIQIIKRVSENASPYALFFRALVPLRFQLSENVPMLICILCTYQYPKMGF